MKRLLIITHEPLRENISGPGIRALEVGRALAGWARVTVATPLAPDHHDDGHCAVVAYSFADPSALGRLAENSDLLLVQGFSLARFPFLTRLDLPVIVDLYCPFTLEHLEMTRSARVDPAGAGPPPDIRVQQEAAEILAVQNQQLRLGDFFLCASERQRDLWLGALHAQGRVNPLTYGADPTLRSLIDVVPFGVPDDPTHSRPAATLPAHVLKGQHPGIRSSDRVLLWGGSILDWQDPQTLVRAVAELAARRDDVKLFFMGTRHPNPQVPPMRAVRESKAIASDLGLLDRHVFFNDWVPYTSRAAYLADADIGVSTHRDHLETRFSFRTRMLDYIWMRLPIVCTTGDHFAELVETRGLGLTVPPDDPRALADAIGRLLDDRALREGCRENLRRIAEELKWERVVEPLRRFCQAPRFAADREPAMRAFRTRLEGSFRVTKWAKRTALRLGVTEATIERAKHWLPVRAGMILRNRLARARAERS